MRKYKLVNKRYHRYGENIKINELKVGDLINLVTCLQGSQSNSNQIKTYDKTYRIVRTYSAGVFAGYIESRNGQEVVMSDARRLWYWSGANSLSELSLHGVSNPRDCKFPEAVDRIELLRVIEILDCTNKAEKSIRGVPVWNQK